MPTMSYCSGCQRMITNPEIMINIDGQTLNKVKFSEEGRKSVEPMPVVGQYFLCGPKCASLLMLDLFTRKAPEYEDNQS